MQKEYTANGDNYTLNIEGDNAPTMDKVNDLEKKRGIEAEHRKTAEKKIEDLNKANAKLQKDLESAGGDEEKINQIRKDFQEQSEKNKADWESKLAEANKRLADNLVTTEAERIAQNFVAPDMVIDAIKKRLTTKEIDGEAKVFVLDAEGKETANSVAELQKELIDNPAHKSIVKANAGSGGGANATKGGGAPTDKKWSEMSGTEQVMLRKENPERANNLMNAEGFSTE